MTVSSGQLTVGTVPTLIDGTYHTNFRLWIHNVDNTDALFLGDSNVTTATGMVLQKEQTIELEMNPLERIYVVSAKTGHTLSYLKQV